MNIRNRFIAISIVLIAVFSVLFLLDNDAEEEVRLASLYPVPSAIENYVSSPESPPEDLYVVNFFASWCKGCVKEVNPLEYVHKKTSVPYYGIVIRDDMRNIKHMLGKKAKMYKKIAVNFPLDELESMELDRIPRIIVVYKGNVIYDHEGEINERIAVKRLLPLLLQVQGIILNDQESE